ncbi:MAG: hypothetical protein F7C07_06865 [Desulfurococcales archaeon]|nr:hypothetical protein [Desulfurococcales archaeon]
MIHVEIVLSYIGLVSAVMSYRGYKSEASNIVCVSTEKPSSCKILYSIPQAFFLGRIHFSSLSLVFFGLVAVLATLRMLLGAWNHEPQLAMLADYASKTLWLLALPFIPYLVYLELRVARAVCIWCTIMHVIVVVMASYTMYTLLLR